MGAADFAIETYVALGAGNKNNSYESALMVGFDQYDLLLLGAHNDGKVYLERPGLYSSAGTRAGLPLWLRIEKTGTLYTFKYRASVTKPWTTLGTYTLDKPAAYVGLLENVYDSSTANAVFDVDYFRLERYQGSTATPTPIASTFPSGTPTAPKTPTRTATPPLISPSPTRTPTVTPTKKNGH